MSEKTGCTMPKVLVGTVAFCLATLCVLGLIMSPAFAFGGFLMYCVVQGVLFATRDKCGELNMLWLYSFWVTLTILNALGAYRFLFALEFLVLGQAGVDPSNSTYADQIKECATGYVTIEPKCTDLAFPSGHFLVYDYGLYTHIAGAATALLLGPFQLSQTFRRKYVNVHRLMGRVYSAAIVVGTVGAIILSIHTVSGLVAAIGFFSLSFFWLATLAPALYHIRMAVSKRGISGVDQDHLELHRQWMYRNYSLTLAAVTLRLYLPLLQFFGLSFLVSYQITAWISWVGNAIAAELYIQFVYKKSSLSPETKKHNAETQIEVK